MIGDFDGRPGHVATNHAIRHATERLSAAVTIEWLPTPDLLAGDAGEKLAGFDGPWASPGSPYRSMEGMLEGIRFAREHNLAFTGT